MVEKRHKNRSSKIPEKMTINTKKKN